MRDDYAFRHEQSAAELFTEYQPTAEDIALANKIESFTLTAYTGPLSDESTERRAQIRQGKIDMRADRRMAARLRRGRSTVPPSKEDTKIGGFSI
jgi:hypothetical protein